MDMRTSIKTKVLVVDDSKTYLEFTANSLRDEGYDVITSDNAWISNLVSRERPAMILMDVQLGSVSGVEATSILRKRAFARDTLILLHSSGPEETLSELTQRCGADSYLVKDGQAHNLLKKVKHLLAAHAANS
jgi:DNA-binding response OmpR family regulator